MIGHAEYLGFTTSQFTRGRWYSILDHDKEKGLYRLADDWGVEGWFSEDMFAFYSEHHGIG